MANILQEIGLALSATLIVVGFILVGLVDYFVGVEVRTYPLYFIPLSFSAWRFGKVGAIFADLISTAIWCLSNWAAGMRFSMGGIWLANILSQILAFGTVAGLLSWARNLLEREQILSRTDSLTGLVNLRSFYASMTLTVAACRRNERPLTLAYIDIDNFKCVNDRYGHARGDALLREVATILNNATRVTDIVARVGGDEFIICLPETSKLQAQPILERLRDELANMLPEDECAISASIGALCWDIPAQSVEDMISAADKTMYQVKKSGKNQVTIISMPM